MIARDVREEAGSLNAGAEVASDVQRGVVGGPVQVVEFLLGREYFAIDLFDVREVVEYTHITHLPSAPEYIRGIIDLRGEITTIIDLKTTLKDANSASVAIKGERRRTINPVFGLVARWFFMGETHPVEETLNLVKEGDSWKVCGKPFQLLES